MYSGVLNIFKLIFVLDLDELGNKSVVKVYHRKDYLFIYTPQQREQTKPFLSIYI